MSQLNTAALVAQVVTAWVALFLLWQTWRDRRRDQASAVIAVIEKDQLGAQSLTVLNEGNYTIQLNVVYQYPIGPKGIPDTKEAIITHLDNPLLAPRARESIPLDGRWDFMAQNEAGDPTEAGVALSFIDTRSREWIRIPGQRKPVTGRFWLSGFKLFWLFKIVPSPENVIIRHHPDRSVTTLHPDDVQNPDTSRKDQ
jgi:hypothetical protein